MGLAPEQPYPGDCSTGTALEFFLPTQETIGRCQRILECQSSDNVSSPYFGSYPVCCHMCCGSGWQIKPLSLEKRDPAGPSWFQTSSMVIQIAPLIPGETFLGIPVCVLCKGAFVSLSKGSTLNPNYELCTLSPAGSPQRISSHMHTGFWVVCCSKNLQAIGEMTSYGGECQILLEKTQSCTIDMWTHPHQRGFHCTNSLF